tara:strand:+ start:989 stop:2041 length:1053 start_codon:yes stop_codon:yes gene_type:complete
MEKYYTRACNFYYGSESKSKVKKKLSLQLNGNNNISFDCIEILTRKSKKKIHIKEIKNQSKNLRKKIFQDLKIITQIKRFKKLNLKKTPILMGVLNLTPDSFSDGGKFNKKNLAYKHCEKLIRAGCKIIDIGGESTRPGSHEINKKKEWKRVSPIIKKLKKQNKFISLDTRKSWIMEKGIKNNVTMINDISGLNYDSGSLKVLKKYNISFVVHHIQGNPKTMQKNPKYKNVLLDVYDYFEQKINEIRKIGIKHNNILLDPGIGFGKNLKHNITLISNISIFHSLGFPILIGISRKRFIKDLSGNNDTKNRIGGTVSSTLYGMMQGVQIFRVHDVNEVNQSIKVFNSLKFK